MKSLFKKELNFYLNNPLGYIIIVLFAVFANFFYIKDIFIIGSASMKPFFNLIPWLFLVFIPAISMRAIAEEKKSNTIETLLTLPISETQIILSKFFAILLVSAISIVLTLSLPVTLSFLTNIYLLEILIGYIGIILLAALYISISLFFSSKTKNQVVAFLVSIIVLFSISVMATDFTASVLPKFMLDFLTYFAPLYQIENFFKGVIDLRSLIYFLSFTSLFLFLTIIDLEKRD